MVLGVPNFKNNELRIIAQTHTLVRIDNVKYLYYRNHEDLVSYSGVYLFSTTGQDGK